MKHVTRPEDRRSCHNISFILGLAIAADRADLTAAAFNRMLEMWTQVPNQRRN